MRRPKLWQSSNPETQPSASIVDVLKRQLTSPPRDWSACPWNRDDEHRWRRQFDHPSPLATTAALTT